MPRSTGYPSPMRRPGGVSSSFHSPRLPEFDLRGELVGSGSQQRVGLPMPDVAIAPGEERKTIALAAIPDQGPPRGGGQSK